MKVRFQTPEIGSKYRSTFGALGTIIKEERFIGLYKGITSPLVRSKLHGVARIFPTYSGGTVRKLILQQVSCAIFEWPYIHFLPLLHKDSVEQNQVWCQP